MERDREIANLDQSTRDYIVYHWPFWARANQLPPAAPWTYWAILAGRGWGKTRTGAETVRMWARDYAYVNLIGATVDDARDIMIDGESGILAICPGDERPIYKKNDRKLVWPSGAISLIFTADEPDRLRGKQHMKLWADELAAWRYADSWDQAMFGLRLGDNPQAVVTTTPRPIKMLRDLIADPGCIVTRGRTQDNRRNLAPTFLSKIVGKYEGTRLGRQELDGELIDDVAGALWQRDMLDAGRVGPDAYPELRRIVIGVDPPVSSGEKADECGIIVAGVGADGHGYVLADRTTKGQTPEKWAGAVVAAYHEFAADRVIAEVNNGGDLVESIIRHADANISYRAVRASRGKVTRAEPVSQFYEQGKVHHCGSFPTLEDQMCAMTQDFDPKAMGYSPDRVDALVWAFFALMVEPREMKASSFRI